MRVGRALPHRAKRPHASHAPPADLRPKAILLESLQEARCYEGSLFRSDPLQSKYVDIVRRRGLDVAAAGSSADAIVVMPRQIFEALEGSRARYSGFSELHG
jgi:hypothetical protein